MSGSSVRKGRQVADRALSGRAGTQGPAFVRDSLESGPVEVRGPAPVRDRDRQLKDFQNRENIAKLVNTVAEKPAHVNELKLRLNEYIREIDKCLAYLRE